MIICTTDVIPGKRVVKCLGMVRGNTVRTRHIGHDIMAQLRNLIGGEVSDYTKMLAETREQSLDRMVTEAVDLGANAIICVRFSTSYIMTGAA